PAQPEGHDGEQRDPRRVAARLNPGCSLAAQGRIAAGDWHAATSKKAGTTFFGGACYGSLMISTAAARRSSCVRMFNVRQAAGVVIDSKPMPRRANAKTSSRGGTTGRNPVPRTT